MNPRMQEFRRDCPDFYRRFTRMEELGFQLETGCRLDGLDSLIVPLLTDPDKSAEVGALYAVFLGPNADGYAAMLESFLVAKETAR